MKVSCERENTVGNIMILQKLLLNAKSTSGLFYFMKYFKTLQFSTVVTQYTVCRVVPSQGAGVCVFPPPLPP